MSSKAVTRRDGTDVSDDWYTRFEEATFRPLRYFNVEDEHPVNSRTRQGGQVCLVKWIDSIENSYEFYGTLKAAMPPDTKIYGYKDRKRCYTILGFSHCFDSWAGLKEHLFLSYVSNEVEVFVLEEGNDVGEWIEWLHIYCRALSPIFWSRIVFGQEFVEEDLNGKTDGTEDGILRIAGDMWNCRWLSERE